MGRDERFAALRRQRMEQSQQAQRRQLLGGIPSAQAEPRDRFGVPIRVGDLVIHRPEPDPIFEVVDVKPVMNPQMPPGMVIVTLAIQMPVYLSTLQPTGNVMVWGNVKDAAEPVAAAPSNIESPAEPTGLDPAQYNPSDVEESKQDAPLVTLTD